MGGALDLALELLPQVKAAAGKFRRALRVDELCLRLTWGEPDPADAAIHYGRAWGIVEALLAFLEANFVLKHREVSLHLDYQIERPRLFVRAQPVPDSGPAAGHRPPFGVGGAEDFVEASKTNGRGGGRRPWKERGAKQWKESSCQ